MTGYIQLGLITALALVAATSALAGEWHTQWKKKNGVWKGVHLGVGSQKDLENVQKQIPALAEAGVNTIIVEVNYAYEFTSRPEMKDDGGVTKDGARAFTKACREKGIRVVPMINCVGHQSWAENTATLLKKHPELDETPGQYPNNKDIYCRSWCVQHPDIPKIVFPLIDELVDAFDADAFHVGLDEVFLIGSEHCPRCKGKDPAELFAKAVNDLHAHIVGKRKLEMMMWGDRLLDGKATGYGEWEAATNGTAPAIDRIPKDIVICDWHYETRTHWPSIRIFADKGFRVWPSSWKNPQAAELFSMAGRSAPGGKVVGHLVTTWGAVKVEDLPKWPPLQKSLSVWP